MYVSGGSTVTDTSITAWGDVKITDVCRGVLANPFFYSEGQIKTSIEKLQELNFIIKLDEKTQRFKIYAPVEKKLTESQSPAANASLTVVTDFTPVVSREEKVNDKVNEVSNETVNDKLNEVSSETVETIDEACEESINKEEKYDNTNAISTKTETNETAETVLSQSRQSLSDASNQTNEDLKREDSSDHFDSLIRSSSQSQLFDLNLLASSLDITDNISNEDKEAAENAKKKVINSFVKIYGAIRSAQNDKYDLKKWLEHTQINVLEVNQAYARMQALAKLVDKSRTCDAWILAKEHSEKCNPQNKTLIGAIQYSAFSRGRFFSATKYNGETFYRSSTLKKKIENEELDLNKVTEGSKLHRIIKALS